MKRSVKKGLQRYSKKTPTKMFFYIYWKTFKSAYFEDTSANNPFLISCSKEQYLAAASVSTLLLNSDNLLTGYDQVSSYIKSSIKIYQLGFYKQTRKAISFKVYESRVYRVFSEQRHQTRND